MSTAQQPAAFQEISAQDVCPASMASILEGSHRSFAPRLMALTLGPLRGLGGAAGAGVAEVDDGSSGISWSSVIVVLAGPVAGRSG